MSIELCVLGSGSSGNCSLVRTPAGVLLIDAGIGPRIIARRLNGTGVSLTDISAICLTHLDSDHIAVTWITHAIRHGLVIYCHGDCVERLRAMADDARAADVIRAFDSDGWFDLFQGLRARAIPLAHDREGSHGFLLQGFGHRLGYATDLGQVPPRLIEHFVDLDVLAIESNYDPVMQEQSARPAFLKRRITGGRGHLSNEQALDAVRKILDRAQRRPAGLPSHIVLLHRSRQCNCPRLMHRLFSADVRIAPRLVLSEPYSRTQWLSRPDRKICVGEQLLLAWG